MKTVAIMVRRNGPLKAMSPNLLAAAYTFLIEGFRGLDNAHGERWRHLWKSFVKGTREGLTMYVVIERDSKYHAMHMDLEGRLMELQDCFPETRAGKEAFRDWLKTGARFGHWEAAAGVPHPVFVPGSVSYDECSDAEMRDFHESAVEFLHTDFALEKLWPNMNPDDRPNMLEAAIKGDPDEEKKP